MSIQFATNNSQVIDKVNKFVDDWQSDSLTVEVQTSGSTGNPKTLTLAKSYMKASAVATGEFLNLKVGTTALLCLPPETIGGKMMIVRSIVLGLELIVGDINASPFENVLPEIEFTAMTPMQLENSIEDAPDKINQLTELIIGGAPVSEELIHSIQAVKARVHHTFGMTETISHIALRCLNQPLEDHFNVLPGITVTTNEHNCLIIDAPGIGVNDLVTNDIVERINKTKFRWKGRSDFAINSGGIKLHPEEIEAQLSMYINGSFFVSGVPDQQLGEKLVLHIEKLPVVDLNKTFFNDLLGKYRAPKEIHFYDHFKRTVSGKIDRLQTLKTSSSVIRKVL